jgi:hypothetical protein
VPLLELGEKNRPQKSWGSPYSISRGHEIGAGAGDALSFYRGLNSIAAFGLV